MRIFAIGDVHGHFTELQNLLEQLREKASYTPDTDHLVLLGDLVDAGPKSRNVIEWCIDYQKKYPDTFHPLKGNHDDMMVDALKYKCKKYQNPDVWITQGGYETLLSYKKDPNRTLAPIYDDEGNIIGQEDKDEVEVPKEHLDFLDSLPLYWWPDKSEYFFCHAGVPPEPLSQFDPDDPQTQDALIWIRGDFYNSPIYFGRKIIFAHTPFESHKTGQFEPFVKENMIGINTMPRDEGKLTAIRLPEEDFFFEKKYE